MHRIVRGVVWCGMRVCAYVRVCVLAHVFWGIQELREYRTFTVPRIEGTYVHILLVHVTNAGFPYACQAFLYRVPRNIFVYYI